MTNFQLKLSPKNFIYIELLFFLNKQWIIELLHLPAFISRLDFVIVLLGTIWVLPNFRKKLNGSNGKWALGWIAGFSLIVIMGWMLNGFSIVRGFWAYFSRTAGIFIFFPMCVGLLNARDIKYIVNMMCKIQIFNVVLTLYQRFFQGLSGDYLGGIFGTFQGANGSTNVFELVLFIFLLAEFLKNRDNIKKFLFFSLTFVVNAALSDIVAFYLEIMIVVGIVVIFMRMDKKKINFLFIGIIGVVVALYIFSVLYSERFKFLMNLNNLKRYIGIGKDYVGVYGISRLNPFAQIHNMFFKGDILKILFGYGLGNCEYSESFATLQSPFFQANRYFRYYWFSSSITYTPVYNFFKK